MVELKFTQTIGAAPEKVHQIMLDRETYREWTKVFSSSSDIVGDWSEGSKMHFTSVNETNNIEGMVGIVEKNILGETVVLRHIGILQDQVEILGGPLVDSWKDAKEIYRFDKLGEQQTQLTCIVQVDEKEATATFSDMWNTALKKLKQLSEQ